MRDDTKDKLEFLLTKLKEKNGDGKSLGTKNQIVRKSFWIAKKEKLKISPNTIKQYVNWIMERLPQGEKPTVKNTDPTDFAIKYIADVGKYKEIAKVSVHYIDGTVKEFYHATKKITWDGLFDYGQDGKRIVVQKGAKAGLDFNDKKSVRSHFEFGFSVVEWLKNMKEFAVSGKLEYWNKHTKKDIETIDMLIVKYRALMPKL